MRALTRGNSSEYNPFTISSAVCLTGEFKGGKSDEGAPRESGREGTRNSEGTSIRDPRRKSDSRDAEPNADDCDGRNSRLAVLGTLASDSSKPSSAHSPLSKKASA
eukprot:1264334-Pleurochrysis_carterae.AAC.2